MMSMFEITAMFAIYLFTDAFESFETSVIHVNEHANTNLVLQPEKTAYAGNSSIVYINLRAYEKFHSTKYHMFLHHVSKVLKFLN